MKTRILISEDERNRILSKHAQKGLTLSEKVDMFDESVYETYDEPTEEIELDETYDEPHEEMDLTYDDMSLEKETGRMVPYEREEEEGYEEEESGLPENPKYEKSLEDSDGLYEEPIYEIEIEEDDEDAPFEKGPRGMRAARTRADYDPTSRESELYGVFGKHGEDIDPTTIRYMRKNPKAILRRMADIYGTDKIQSWLDM
jgi:hypothetical protein